MLMEGAAKKSVRIIFWLFSPDASTANQSQLAHSVQSVWVMQRHTTMKKWSIISLLALLGVSCATAPFTQRTQVMLVEEAQTITLGEQLYQQVLQQSRINRKADVTRLVQKVGGRIAAAANKPEYSWEFTVIEDPDMINAWVLPGGKVGIYTGIFPIAYDEAGLAVILGHEVAHAIARHAGERMSQDVLLQLGSAGLSAALGKADPSTTRMVAQAFGLGANFGVILPFNRVQESEADHIGLILTAKAGYDPHAALEVWERMARVEGERPRPPEFLSTHPSYDTRRRNIQQWLQEALQYYEPGRMGAVERLPSL